MVSGRRSWWSLVLGACLVALSGEAFFWLTVDGGGGSDSGGSERAVRAAIQWCAIGGGIAGLILLAVAVVMFHGRRSAFRGMVAAARSISSGNLSVEVDTAGLGELADLATSLDAIRRRAVSQAETIERQRQMLQGLVHQSQEGVVVADLDDRIALINPSAARLLDLEVGSEGAARLLGVPVAECMPRDDVRRLLSGTAPSRPGLRLGGGDAGDRRGPGMSDTRLEIESRNGTRYLLARISTLVMAESDRQTRAGAMGHILLLTDITELERTIRMRSDFVANASHELRTPLSTIRAAVETLLTMDLKTEESHAAEFLEKIERQSSRLQQMVADLLDLSRVESPAERFEVEPLDTEPVLDELHARFAKALESKGLRWEVNSAALSGSTILANHHLLRLVLDNLVDNAIKFTDPGGTIRVGLRTSDEWAIFEIVDEGCGIPEDEQQRVFERFYQVQRSRSGPKRGTGLGLSIVRHAVEAMGGKARLASDPDGGTRAIVVVPQVAE